jgi:hypothetical protein
MRLRGHGHKRMYIVDTRYMATTREDTKRYVCCCTFKFKVQCYLTNDGQSASLSWYEATLWDPQPVFLSPPQKLTTYICGFLVWGALSDERMNL